jgi:glycosyltransferase involved in cell wall biosynthesis
MRILVVIDSLYTGGAEFSTLLFYSWLQKKGYQVQLVCLKHAHPSYETTSFQLKEPIYLTQKRFVSKFFELRTIIKKFKPTVVHSVLFQSNMITRFCRLSLRNFVHLESLVNETYSPYRVKENGISAFKLLCYRMLDGFFQRIGTDHFHANGVSVAKHYEQYLKIPSNKITVVHRGRNGNPFAFSEANKKDVREQFETGERILLIHVGRHEYQKGQEILLKSISILKQKGLQLQLIIAGREGKATPLLKDEIKRSGLEQNVILAGHRNDIASLLAASDIFIFPSRFEGLPGALIEAEAAALPIIASAILNNKEVAEENSNAFFFPVDDITSLCSQLETLIKDKSLRIKMGKNSFEIFQKRFQLSIIHQQMEALLIGLTKLS